MIQLHFVSGIKDEEKTSVTNHTVEASDDGRRSVYDPDDHHYDICFSFCKKPYSEPFECQA
jgi:hypothetical protein